MFRSRSPAFESFEHLHHCKCHHLHSDGISAGCLPSVDLVFMRVRRFEFRGTSTSTCSDYFYFAVSLYVSSDLLCVRHIVPISRKPSPLGGYYLLHVALLRQMNRPLSRVVGPKLFNRTSTGFCGTIHFDLPALPWDVDDAPGSRESKNTRLSFIQLHVQRRNHGVLAFSQ